MDSSRISARTFAATSRVARRRPARSLGTIVGDDEITRTNAAQKTILITFLLP